jgi:SAM-dependent methyltransferase
MRRQGLQERYNRWHEERLTSGGSTELDEREARFYDWLVGLTGEPAGGQLLDVACGQGKFLAYAHSRGFELTGVDVSDVAVEIAGERVPEAHVVLGAGESLPFEDDSFDVVTCIGSLEHFPDPAAGAAEMARVLRPGGSAVIFVPNLFFLGHVWFGVSRGTQPSEGGQAFSEIFLSSQGWQELLGEAGLEVSRFDTWNHIFASDRVSPVVQKAWNKLSWLVPRHGAYAFAFVCQKSVAS